MMINLNVLNLCRSATCLFLSHLFIAGCDIGVQYRNPNFRTYIGQYVGPSIRSCVRPLTFTSKFGNFSAPVIAVSVKPSIVIVLDISFKLAP